MEFIFVTTLFALYLALWEIKRRSQIKATGKDPKVLGVSGSPVQVFFSAMTIILTVYIALIIVAHGAGIQWYSLFTRFPLLDGAAYDIIGFIIGLAGLSLCAIAQRTMKNSWRVGIDENIKTDLVKSGIYRYIRNPTYTGLFILNIGVWMIWPTWTIALFALMFYTVMEMQVRCEEEFLQKTHGDEYIGYLKSTSRYIPKRY